MRLLVFTTALLIAASASASFDLMFIPNRTTGVIHRVDPVNSINLGTVGSAFTGRTALATSGSSHVFGSTTTGVGIGYNYSTGIADYTGYAGQFSSMVTYSELGSTRTIIAGFTGAAGSQVIDSFSPTGAIASTAMPAGFDGRQVLGIGTNKYWVMGYNTAGDYVAYLSTASNLAVSGSEFILLSAAELRVGRLNIGQSVFFIGEYNYCVTSYRDSATGAWNFRRVNINPTTGALGNVSASQLIVTGPSGNAGLLNLLPAHEGFYSLQYGGTSSGVVRRYGSTGPFQLSGQSSINVPVPYDVTWRAGIVLAPEPASLLVLLPASWLLLRRRRLASKVK